MCSKRVLLATFIGLILQLCPNTSSAAPAENSVRINAETVKAEPFKKENWDLYWKMLSGGRHLNDKTDESIAATLGVYSQLEWRISSDLRFYSELKAVFNSQRMQQDVFGDDFDDGFRMREAVVMYEPLTWTSFGAGAINQTRLNSPLLIADRTFPGLFQQVYFGERDKNGVGLELQELIPTSKSFNSQRVEKEKTPFLYTATVAGAWTPTSVLTLKPQATYFQFQDLPSRVALDSALFGNTTDQGTVSNKKFQYEFAGTSLGLETDLKISKSLTLTGGFQSVNNQRAPSAFNTGRLGSLGAKIKIGGAEIKPEVISFYNESDTSPGVYNEGKFGHNNRQGWGAKLGVDFKKLGFNIRSEFYDADVVNENKRSGQSRQQYLSIYLETTYAEIL